MKRLLEPMTRLAAVLTLTLMLSATSTTLLAQTLQITSPTDGTVVNPGERITVTVAVSGGSVPYVILAMENPIPYHEMLTAPPYRFSVQIPSRISLGRYSAIAGFLGGKRDEGTYARIFIDVERPDAPVRVEVQPSLLNLEVGGPGFLSAYATYADGTTADVKESTLTKWSSDSPDVATVTDDGRVTAVGPGSAKITLKNAGQIAVVPVTVENPRRAVDPKP